MTSSKIGWHGRGNVFSLSGLHSLARIAHFILSVISFPFAFISFLFCLALQHLTSFFVFVLASYLSGELFRANCAQCLIFLTKGHENKTHTHIKTPCFQYACEGGTVPLNLIDYSYIYPKPPPPQMHLAFLRETLTPSRIHKLTEKNREEAELSG